MLFLYGTATTDIYTDWPPLSLHDALPIIEPPREGAESVARALAALSPAEKPQRIVYVSCSTGTLARDAGILCHEGGYRLQGAGVVNMFPHTGHVESIAVFDAQ